MKLRQWQFASAMLLALALLEPAAAEKKYGPGVTDSEITVGQTMPYSGPASAYGTIGKAETAYFRMVNEQGGVNGRKIVLMSLDDAYTPSKTVEQTRKLIEQEGVLLIFSTFGTVTNAAVQRYLNEHSVPQLFAVSGAARWDDHEHFPWTIGFPPSYQIEGRIVARYILGTRPGAKIGLLYQNDDFGKDYVKGLKDGLGAMAKMIVGEVSYDVTDPTVDSQIVTLKASGADVFVDVSTAKFAAQAIRKAFDIGWKPLHLLPSLSTARTAVLEPAGLEKAVGIVSPQFAKDPTDPQWKNDPATKEWIAWMSKYYPDGDKTSTYNVSGYNWAMTLVQVLKQCGDDVTRENVMRQAASLDLSLPMLLPGIKVRTGPNQFSPIRDMQLKKFDGQFWESFGEVIRAE